MAEGSSISSDLRYLGTKHL